MNKLILSCFPLLLLIGSCAKNVDSEVQVYTNDFEIGNVSGITNSVISLFNGTKVLGMYSNNGFSLRVNDLPKHAMLDISFDLYIHDNWVGNQALSENENTPDIWQLKINNKTFISTTFSNQDCIAGNICPPQSYPANYPNNNYNPRSYASGTALPGVCSKINSQNGTSLYKIHKLIEHSDQTLLMECLDQVSQKNVSDLKCNSSWSVDNINIKAINLH